MFRTPRHKTRRVATLEGIWDFSFLGDVEPDEPDVSAIAFDEIMPGPGCFDATPAHAGRRGLVAYRRTIDLTDKSPHRLVIDGLHHWGRAFVDGESIGEHAGGYTRFGLDFTPTRTGEAELVILVDNRFSPKSPLHLDWYDWYHYGGISRGIELHRLGETWIDAIRFVTVDFRSGKLAVEVDWASRATAEQVPLTVRLGGKQVKRVKVKLHADHGTRRVNFTAGSAALWSPDEPNLHLLEVALAEDDWRGRVGIRQIEVEGKDILCNGQPLQLRGFNRHESHTLHGCAQPEHLLIADVQRLKEMGCNFVRGSHYPQDERFLELCDEAGLCVWVEGNGWQNKAHHLTDEPFLSSQEVHLREMVAQSTNHPSVILWGLLNEAHTDDPECRPAFERLIGLLRQLDPTRPVTFATCRQFKDVCLDLCDVISVNMYPGWYWREIDEIGTYIDEVTDWLDEVGVGDRPFIVSEIGAGALPGWRDAHRDRWSEDYQARLLTTAVQDVLARQRAMGLAIWMFADIRTSDTPGMMRGKPRGFNNKGVLDEYRRPKLAMQAVANAFAALDDSGEGSFQQQMQRISQDRTMTRSHLVPGRDFSHKGKPDQQL